MTPKRSIAQAAWRFVRGAAHVVSGLWTIRTRFEQLDTERRADMVRVWSVQLLEILGVELVIRGAAVAHQAGGLLVANHISWLDILVMNAAKPARFVSKSDVKHWPLLGSLITGAGTLYIERESRRDAMRVVHQVADRLRANDLIAIFPEGTTSDGREMLPFHANLFQAALAAQAPVIPVALAYAHAQTGDLHASPTYVGDATLLGSIWATLRASDVQAVLIYGPAQLAADRDRRTWAREVREDIAALLRNR